MRMSSSSPTTKRPTPAQRFQVAFGQRVFLAQQVVGQHAQFQTYAAARSAVHAEYVDEAFVVFGSVFPRRVGELHGADARRFEELVRVAFEVVAPHLHIVGRESERFHPAVADLAAVRRLVTVQDRLPLLLDGFDQPPDVRGVLAPDHGVGQRLVVVDRVEFAFEILFQDVVVVDIFDGAFQDHGLLFGEVHQLRDVAEMRRLLVETDAVARFLDDESRIAEGVDIAVDRAARHLEPFGQLVDVVGGVRCQQLHQPQQAFQFGLVHASWDILGKGNKK